MKFDNRAVPIVLAAVLIDSIGFGIVLPVLPRLIVDLGQVTLARATEIGGWMLFAFAAAQFVAGPILGNLGDRFGRRPVLLAGMLAFGIDYALMAFAPSLGWLFLGRVIAGITGAIYGPANAVLADATPPEKRGAVFGLMGGAFGIGFILGPALGGILAGFGPKAPFLAAAALAMVNAAAIALLLPETLKPEDRRAFEWRRANMFGAFKPLFHAGNATPLLVCVLLWQMSHMVYPATWSFWAELTLGWDAASIGWSLAASGLAMAIAQTFLTGRIVARVGEERAAMLGLTAAGLVFLGYGFVNKGWQVYVLIPFSALGGLVFPSFNAILSRRVDARNQGALQGGMAGLGSIAAIAGPLVMNNALASGSRAGFPGAAFVLAGLLALGVLAILWFGIVRRPVPVPQELP